MSPLHIGNGGIVGHIDGFRYRAGKKWLGRRHHADVRLRPDKTFAIFSTLVGTIKNRIMALFKMGSIFNCHPSANAVIGHLDFFFCKTQMPQQAEVHGVQLFIGQLQHILAEPFPHDKFIERETDIENLRQFELNIIEHFIGKAFLTQGIPVDVRSGLKASRAHAIFDDILDLIGFVTQPAKRTGNRLVDNLEITAPCQFFIFDECVVRFNACGIAIHQQSDRTRWRNTSGLGITESVAFSQCQCIRPFLLGRIEEIGGAMFRMDTLRESGEAVILMNFHVMRRAPVVFQNLKHGVPVILKVRKRAKLTSHFRRHGISGSRSYGRNRAADSPTAFRVIRNSHHHEQGSEVGITETESAKIETLFSDGLIRKLRHDHRNFQSEGPHAASVPVVCYCKNTLLFIVKTHQVDGGEIAGGIIQEHVFGAGIGSSDRPVIRAGMPLVDRRVKLESRVRTGPGGMIDLFPQILGWQGLDDLSVCPAGQVPVAIAFDSTQELVGEPDRVIGVLPRNSQVAF